MSLLFCISIIIIIIIISKLLFKIGVEMFYLHTESAFFIYIYV